MQNIEDMIIDAVDNRFKVLADRLQFDKTYYGKVVSIAGRYATVNINGVEYKAQIKDGIFVSVDNVVVLKAPNGNFSFLYIDGKLGEATEENIADLSNQIGVLSEKDLALEERVNTLSGRLNNFGVYTDFRQLGQTVGSETITSCISAMANFSLAFITVNTSCNQTQYPTLYGTIKIFKQQNGRVNAYFSTSNGMNEYFAEINSNAFIRWIPAATTDKIDISFPYSSEFTAYGNGYASSIYKVNNHISIKITYKRKDGANFSGLHTVGVLPVGYRPPLSILNSPVAFAGGVEIRSTGEVMVNCPDGVSYGISVDFYL